MSEPVHAYTDIIACDFSYYRPGFAHLRYYPRGRKVAVIETSNIDNKNASGKKKPHGQILSEIASELRRYLTGSPMGTLVREQALSIVVGYSKTNAKYYNPETIKILHEVVGVADLYAWGLGGRVFDEIGPKAVKKYVTGNGLAEKDDVAKALPQFVGEREYACDDESDAVAVGIAWLIQQGMIDDPYAKPKKTSKKKVESECNTSDT